jgi:D-sedoheptulose 7-phosphate isomerase
MKVNQKNFKNSLKENLKVTKSLDKNFIQINKAIEKISDIFSSDGKIMFCGNGGSAADAQHLTAELLVRLNPSFSRKSLPAICLAQDVSTITACSNDLSFDKIFSRNLSSLGKENDLLFAISTSGNSKNIINVLKEAKKKKIYSIALLGSNGGKCLKLTNLPIIVKSKNTARIQEAHIFLGHFILQMVEKKLKSLSLI